MQVFFSSDLWKLGCNNLFLTLYLPLLFYEPNNNSFYFMLCLAIPFSYITFNFCLLYSEMKEYAKIIQEVFARLFIKTWTISNLKGFWELLQWFWFVIRGTVDFLGSKYCRTVNLERIQKYSRNYPNKGSRSVH